MARLTGIQRIMEVGMIISCVFAFFLLLAMASFHPADPGWSQAGLQSDVFLRRFKIYLLQSCLETSGESKTDV